MKIVRLIIVAEPIKRTCSSSEITRSTFHFMHERTLTSCLSLMVFTFCSSILFFCKRIGKLLTQKLSPSARTTSARFR